MSRRGVLLSATMALALTACSGDETTASGPQGPDNTAITAPTSPPSQLPTQEGASGATTRPRNGSPSPTASRPVTPRLAGVVARNLRVPWGIDFLPDGSALVTERDRATIRRIRPSGRVTTIGTVDRVAPTAEGGLLGIAVSPNFANDELIYVYFSTREDNRVVTIRYSGRRLGPQRALLTGIPVGSIHDGGGLQFGPEGKLYISTGETGDEQIAQERGSLGGKVLRLNPDGSVPADNPDPSSPVWTLGHRNVQGLAFDRQDRLWATEFGSDVWDELNRIERNRNYGWPAAEGDASLEGFVDPLVQWRPSNASPSGMAYAGGSLWAASLRGQRLWRIPIRRNGSVGRPRALLIGDYGRLRAVVRAPDGSLWVSTSNHDGRGFPAAVDDRIVRIVLR